MNQSRFIAFDVETPNRYNNRMSAIGIIVVEDGRIAEKYYTPVDPEAEFDRFNTRLTGLDADAVRGAPTFSALWPRIKPIFESGLLVAHNAVFDLGVLKSCLRDYDVPWRRYVRYVCTVQMGRRVLPDAGHRLNELCGYYGIPLAHHHAGSDALACAEILLRYMGSGADVRQFIRTYSLEKRGVRTDGV